MKLSGPGVLFVVVESLSRVRFFVTPWTAAHQASLFIISWSLLRLMSLESVMPPNHLILCCPLLLLPSTFPSIRDEKTIFWCHQHLVKFNVIFFLRMKNYLYIYLINSCIAKYCQSVLYSCGSLTKHNMLFEKFIQPKWQIIFRQLFKISLTPCIIC